MSGHELFESFRSQEIEKRRQENINQLFEHLTKDKISKEEKYKLFQHYQKYSYEFRNHSIFCFDDFIEYCKKSKLNCLGIELDPVRQGIDESLQIQYFNQKFQRHVKKLPGTGKNAYCFTSTIEILSPVGKSFKLGERTKTFDAIECTPEKNTYFTFKYTKQTGGNQDNQMKDIYNFIHHAELYIQQHKWLEFREEFVVVLSGNVMKKFYEDLNKLNLNPRIHLYYLA